MLKYPKISAGPVLRSNLNHKSISRVQFSGIKEDLEAVAAQKQMEASRVALTDSLLTIGNKSYTGLQLLELAQSFEAEAKNKSDFKSIAQWLFFRPTTPGIFDVFAMARLLNQASSNPSETVGNTTEKLKNAFEPLKKYGFVACPDKLNGHDGLYFNLWVLTEKGKAAINQAQLGIENLSLKAETGLKDVAANASLELTAKRIRWFAQSFGQHGLSGLNLADCIEAATRKKGWFSSKIFYKSVSLNGFLKGFTAQKEMVKAALLEMETLGLLTRNTSGAEPTISLTEVGLKLVSQLQGKDAMKVSARTFQVVIQQEIAERKTAIAQVEQDMSAWGQKIEVLEKDLLVQDADLESLRKTATGLAVQLQTITEPLSYQKINEKLKDSVLALRFAEVKVKAEASHLKRLTQRYDGMKTAFKRWESTQMTQMQRLMEMQKELELKVGFDKVSDQLRGQISQGDQDFNALFQTLLKLDQEGVLPTGGMQETRTADQAAALQQGVDKALLEMEQMGLVEGFLKELDDKANSEALASVKKSNAS